MFMRIRVIIKASNTPEVTITNNGPFHLLSGFSYSIFGTT